MSTTPSYNAMSPSLEAELHQDEALAVQVPALPIPTNLGDLLPTAFVELSPAQLAQVERASLARKILGPAGAAILTCPSAEQLNKCPHVGKCEYVRMGADKIPHGNLCPIEARYVTDKFHDWMREFKRTPQTMTETERIGICELVSLDLKELRCNDILSEPDNARLTENCPSALSEQGNPVEWENIVHRNEQILAQVHADRRMILKSFELTPEMLTKKRRMEGDKDKIDISSRQAALAAAIASAVAEQFADDDEEPEP